VAHARRAAAPILDLSLFSVPTFRAGVLGGFLFRLGIGALPFLLPLLLQLGFKLSPFQSGLITFVSALGSMMMKTSIAGILRRFGFRAVLVVNAIVSSAFLAACASFTPGVSFTAMIGVLFVGGFFRSLQFTSVNTIAYAEIEPQRMSRATSLVSVAQQLSLSAGVAVGAAAVQITVHLGGQSAISAWDFPPAFLLVAALSASSALVFAALPPDAGAVLADRSPAPTEAGDQRVG
jgi:MFS family permease